MNVMNVKLTILISSKKTQQVSIFVQIIFVKTKFIYRIIIL